MGRETKRFSEMLALWKVQQAGQATPSAVATTLGEIGIARSTAYSALQSLSEQGLVEETRTTTPGGASVLPTRRRPLPNSGCPCANS